MYGSHSSKGGFMKNMYLLNKNIVHLIDDIFCNMGLKTETQAEKVIIWIRFIMCIMLINDIMPIIVIMFIIHIMRIIYIILIMCIILIMLIFSFLGSYFSGACRSRVAGQTRRYRPNRRRIGRSVSSSHACWLAVVYSDRLSWWGCSHATNCWRGNFGRAWRWVMICSFCSCQGGCFLQWILTRILESWNNKYNI